MNGRFLLSTIGLCGIFLTGCSVYDPDLLPGAGAWDPGDPPPRPDPATTSDITDTGTIAFAFNNVVLDQGADWQAIGFDLDGYDSVEANGYQGECTPYSPTGTPEFKPDGEYGIDNQFGSEIWQVMKVVLPTLECEINEAFRVGHGTLIMKVEQWNGNPTDGQIRVSIAPAVDGTASPIALSDCANFVGEEVQYTGSNAPAPDWLSEPDNYCINSEGLIAATEEPKVVDANAYIVDGQIIMTLLPGAEFLLYSSRSSVAIKLNQGMISATLNEDLDAIESGFASGRFALSALVEVGAAIGVCDAAAFEETYRELADVFAQPSAGLPTTAECDAISIGVSFQGIEANWVDTANAVVPAKIACDLNIPQPVDACCDAYPSQSQRDTCHAYWP